MEYDLGKNVLSIIKQRYNDLTTVEQKIALHVLANPEKIIYMSVMQIAKEINVSEASIVRFCKSVGFTGYANLKVEMARDLGAETIAPPASRENTNPIQVMQATIGNHVEQMKNNLSLLDWEKLERAADLLREAGRIALFAVGNSHPVAFDAFWRFSNLGKAVFLQLDQGAQLLHARSLGRGDVAFAVSTSGQSRLPISCIEVAGRNGAATICMTASKRSELASLCDCVLLVQAGVQNGMNITPSPQAMQLAVTDAVVQAVLSKSKDGAIKTYEENTRLTRSRQY